jgi:hypothetical protein
MSGVDHDHFTLNSAELCQDNVFATIQNKLMPTPQPETALPLPRDRHRANQRHQQQYGRDLKR